MSHEYLQEGESIDYTNITGVAIAAGSLVLDANNYTIMGISARPIAINEVSSLSREQGAIFSMDKGADVFAVGDNVNFNISLNQATKTPVALGSIIAIGRCVEAVGPGVAGLFMHLVLVFGCLLAWLFLGERLFWFHLVGIALIFAGIYLTTRAASTIPPAAEAVR